MNGGTNTCRLPPSNFDSKQTRESHPSEPSCKLVRFFLYSWTLDAAKPLIFSQSWESGEAVCPNAGGLY